MENILLPSKMTFTPGETKNESVLTIEPLHHGYGTTIGNAMRRILLSSLEGAAVTAVKIKGAQHEFSAVEGVKEDALEVILNLKRLRMRVHSDEPVTLKLQINGREGEVTGADFEKNADVEIVNPDLVLCTMTSKDVELSIDIIVERGRGFLPVEEREDKPAEIGLIAIDAMFTPIVNVGLNIENTRVGEITNYDKLIMTIETDGSITPQEAIGKATKVAQNHFNWIEGQLNHSSLTEKIATAGEGEEEAQETEGDKE